MIEWEGDSFMWEQEAKVRSTRMNILKEKPYEHWKEKTA